MLMACLLQKFHVDLLAFNLREKLINSLPKNQVCRNSKKKLYKFYYKINDNIHLMAIYQDNPGKLVPEYLHS